MGPPAAHAQRLHTGNQLREKLGTVRELYAEQIDAQVHLGIFEDRQNLPDAGRAHLTALRLPIT